MSIEMIELHYETDVRWGYKKFQSKLTGIWTQDSDMFWLYKQAVAIEYWYQYRERHHVKEVAA